ncbi:GIY-YIG nuclease family protein [Thermodesulfobacteriota bacterium]
MHYVYVLLSRKDGRFYTGSTSDLRRRLHEHNSGNVESTMNRRPLELVYYEACINHEDTRAREKYLKSGMGKRYLKNRLKRYLDNL